MKKILSAMVFAFGMVSMTTSAFAASDITGGINLVNSIDGADGAETEFLSPVVFYDSYFMLGSKFGIGTGVGFIYSETNDDEFAWAWTYPENNRNAGNYIMPVYLSGKLYMGSNPSMQPYAKLNLGYAFWWADDQVDIPDDRSSYDDGTEGGFYFGLALGLKVGILTFELDYSTFTGDIYGNYRYSGYSYYYEADVDFNFLSIRAGFSF